MKKKINKFLINTKQEKTDFNNPQIITNIKQVKAEYARGECITWSEMKKKMNLSNK